MHIERWLFPKCIGDLLMAVIAFGVENEVEIPYNPFHDSSELVHCQILARIVMGTNTEWLRSTPSVTMKR